MVTSLVEVVIVFDSVVVTLKKIQFASKLRHIRYCSWRRVIVNLPVRLLWNSYFFYIFDVVLHHLALQLKMSHFQFNFSTRSCTYNCTVLLPSLEYDLPVEPGK